MNFQEHYCEGGSKKQKVHATIQKNLQITGPQQIGISLSSNEKLLHSPIPRFSNDDDDDGNNNNNNNSSSSSNNNNDNNQNQ
jgi:antitoxin component of MazEF toxin-antitoxin module